MKRALIIVALGTALLAGSAIAQSPPPAPGSAPVPTRAIKITAEQGYVIKENVKDSKPATIQPGAVEIGGKAPLNIELHDFPSIVTEKVTTVKNYKFFVAESQVVIVDPKDNTVADIIK
jgi:hypothetical protein